MNILHITYATPNYMRSAKELRASARVYGLKTQIYTRRSPVVRQLYRDHREKLMHPTGAGYWRWKPWVILDAMAGLQEGDALLYTDAGMNMVSSPETLLGLATKQAIVLFEQERSRGEPPRMPAAQWTKRDCFVLLNADEPKYWGAGQLLGGFQLYRVCPESINFVKEWANALWDDRIATDQPNECGLPNLPGFQAHRHDQSVLSILATRHGIIPYQDPSQFGVRYPGEPFGQIFDLHRRRTEPFLGPLRGRLQIGTRVRGLVRRLAGKSNRS